MGYPEHLIQVQPRDLSPYKDGGTGIDYVHTFDSGVDGPHVMINAINKGNEICGSEAVATLLDDKLRPRRGKLTLSFANVAAYEALDVRNPGPAKFLDINFNRIWDDRVLDADNDAREIHRAREMRPVVRPDPLERPRPWNGLAGPIFAAGREDRSDWRHRSKCLAGTCNICRDGARPFEAG
jgi:hypothetical protein